MTNIFYLHALGQMDIQDIVHVTQATIGEQRTFKRNLQLTRATIQSNR